MHTPVGRLSAVKSRSIRNSTVGSTVSSYVKRPDVLAVNEPEPLQKRCHPAMTNEASPDDALDTQFLDRRNGGYEHSTNVSRATIGHAHRVKVFHRRQRAPVVHVRLDEHADVADEQLVPRARRPDAVAPFLVQ